MTIPHTSVLLQEILQVFKDIELRVFIDGTLGAGGHAAALLAAHPEMKQYFGIDQDPLALGIAKERLAPFGEKVSAAEGNFTDLAEHAKRAGLDGVDGILLDLGGSSMQLDMPEKGFSFMRDGPLDMRMSPQNPLTAEEIVNTWSEEELARVIRDYGEEKYWRLAARLIVEARNREAIITTQQLAKALEPLVFRKKKQNRGGIHPLTLIFQGLRIRVNNELEVLADVLPQALRLLRKGGRLAIISFHSLEDRIVKDYFREAASDKVNTSGLAGLFLDKEPEINLITRKPIVPGNEEVVSNPRSRSAKLRVAEKR